MKVDLAYGQSGLVVEVPDDTVVISPSDPAGLEDEAGAVRAALRGAVHGPPLAQLVTRGDDVAVVFPDLTRPFPHRTVLPPLLAEIEAAGGRPRLLCATGTHRQATHTEMTKLIGADLVARYGVHDHDATDTAAHVDLGTVDGVPVLIDRAYVEADVRITTGFVEPHFFAGFSGGAKGVCPGLAALQTVLEAHSPARIADPRATWLEMDANPVQSFVTRAVALRPPTLSLDVAINGRRELTAVFAGPLPDAHRAACAYVERTAVQRVDRRFDVVVTTNAGHPLDRNLYQAVKGMAAAERIVRDGGLIVLAAACVDGVPAEGEFGRLLASVADPSELVRVASGHDQWQVQVLGRILQRARVALYTDGLTAEQVRAAHLLPIEDIAAAVRTAGTNARVAVLPQGPLTVATAAS